MLGSRGASRYYSPRYRQGFELECRARRILRDQLSFRNSVVMIPFHRALGEADRVLGLIAGRELRRGEAGPEVWMQSETSSNAVPAEQFTKRFDGFSNSSNDLTQLTLGVDRDPGEQAGRFDALDPAMIWMIRRASADAHAGGIRVELCGLSPSDRPAFAGFLGGLGIDSASVSPDGFINVKRHVTQAECELSAQRDIVTTAAQGRRASAPEANP